MGSLDIDVLKLDLVTATYGPGSKAQVVRSVANVSLIGDAARRTFVQPIGSTWATFRVSHFILLDNGGVEAYARRYTLDGKPTKRYNELRMCEPHTYGPVIFDLFRECIALAWRQVVNIDHAEALRMHPR